MEKDRTEVGWENNYPPDSREFWKRQAELEKKLSDVYKGITETWKYIAKEYEKLAHPMQKPTKQKTKASYYASLLRKHNAEIETGNGNDWRKEK